MIVAIDDSQTIIAIFNAIFVNRPLIFKGYHSAKEAMPYLRDNTPDLLILDIIMPEQDGISLLNELRQMPHHKETPVIFLTSKDYQQDRLEGKALNAVDFLIKPLSPVELQTVIQDHLGIKLLPLSSIENKRL